MADEYVLKEYEGGTVATTLSALISAGATSIAVTSGSSFPNGATAPFVVVIDRGLAAEEKVLIDTRASNTLTVQQRGYDGTVAQSHAAGASINHCVDAYTLKQVNAMANAMTAQYDLVYRGAAPQSFSRIAVGSNGHLLGVTAGVPGFAALGLANIADGLLTTAKLADNSVTSAKIVDGTIVTADLADSSVTSAKIVDGTIATADIADAAVTTAKLAAAVPLGTVAYAQVTGNQTGISAVTDLTSLTVTFTAVAGRRYRITGFGLIAQKTGTGVATMTITNSANAQQAAAQSRLIVDETQTATPMFVVVPGAGSITYKLRLTTNANTCDLNATATNPAFILAEDIGV